MKFFLDAGRERSSQSLSKMRALRSFGFTRQLEVLLARKFSKVRRDEQTRFAETSTESIVKGSASLCNAAFLLHPSNKNQRMFFVLQSRKEQVY